MPKMKLNLLQTAKIDLVIIANKHKKLVGASSAQKITNKIRKSLELLEDNPFLGKPCGYPEFIDKDFRCLICDVYLCFYKVEPERISVYRIIDGRTDYLKLF